MPDPAHPLAAPTTGPARAQVILRYEHATDKRALFEELTASGFAENYYFAAEILSDCLTVGEQGIGAVTGDFLANLAIDAPATASRLDAFRQSIDPCAGFSGRPTSIDEIQQLYATGAQRGDPRALAHMLMSAGIEEIAGSIRVAASLLESNDPYVIGDVAGFLGGVYARGMVIDGKTLSPADNDSMAMAWALVACDYGAPCGADSRAVLRACAQGGLCGIESLEELFRLTHVPDDTYRHGREYHAQILAALQRRDYASLGLDVTRF